MLIACGARFRVFLNLLLTLCIIFGCYFFASGQQVIISGVKHGRSNETEAIPAGVPVEIAIFGANLKTNSFDQIFLTDADRCEDAKQMKKQIIVLTPDQTFQDNYTIIASSSQGLPANPGQVFRLCTNSTRDSALSTTLLMVEEPPYYFVPFPVLIGLYIGTLIFSGMFSGLNLAYTCISLEHLMMLADSGDEAAGAAKKILPIRKRGNWLIATFAIGNTLVNIVSTLLMEGMLINLTENQRIIMANTIPVLLTMIFGEILPQAICFKRALAIASLFRYIVMIFMALLGIVAWPVSLLLDCILGKEPVRVYSLGKLKALLEIHTQNELLSKVLTFSTVTVGKVMTRIQDAYLMSRNDVLDMSRMVSILEKGYTRVPIYDGMDRRKVVAILNVKDLILIDPDDKKRVFEIIEESHSFKQTMEIRFVSHEMRAQDVMNEMIKGRQHLMMVFRFDNREHSIVGLVTLEDIIEEFIGEIKDDDDAAFPMIRAGVRRDQSTFDWFRSEVDKRTNLTANELLRMMEQILEQCQSLVKLNFTVYGLRALICLSKIEKVDKSIILRKGSILNHVVVVIDGAVMDGGTQVVFPRPVYGACLLDEMYNRIVKDGDQAKLHDIHMVVPENVCLINGRGTIIRFTLSDIFRILVVLCRESQNEDVLTQFDFYMHIMSVMAEITTKGVFLMHASQEASTQQLNATLLKDVTQISVGSKEKPIHSGRKSSKSSKKAKKGEISSKKCQRKELESNKAKQNDGEFYLDPKKEQKTQEEAAPDEEKVSPNRTAVHSIRHESEAEREDKTQNSN